MTLTGVINFISNICYPHVTFGMLFIYYMQSCRDSIEAVQMYTCYSVPLTTINTVMVGPISKYLLLVFCSSQMHTGCVGLKLLSGIKGQFFVGPAIGS